MVLNIGLIYLISRHFSIEKNLVSFIGFQPRHKAKERNKELCYCQCSAPEEMAKLTTFRRVFCHYFNNILSIIGGKYRIKLSAQY